MSYPNAGATANEFSNLISVDPIWLKDLFDNLIDSSLFRKRVIHRYPHRGIDPITGESKPQLKEPCQCWDQKWGVGGKSGFEKCSRCGGAGVIGGWIDEFLDCFFWNQIPPGLQKFGHLFTVPLPTNRATVVVYVKSEEKIHNGDFIIRMDEDDKGEEVEFEYQCMNVRSIIVGDTKLWKWIQCQRQAADITTDKRADI